MNEPIQTVRGRVLPLDRADVDTDQIIPARHLRRTARTGYGAFAFEAWRADPAFMLNDPRRSGAPILVAGPNFGCGSSREHAAWALQELGLKVVIAPSFADIFRTNCVSVGILPVALPVEACSAILSLASQSPEAELTVDLPRQRVQSADQSVDVAFTIDPSEKARLLDGLDPIGASAERLTGLGDFERQRPDFLPTTKETT